MNAGTHARTVRLPGGWQHGPVVRSLRTQPVERRQAMQAAVFAVLAAVWAPIGMLAFFAHWLGTWLLLSAAVALVLLMPLPVSVGDSLRSLVTQARTGLRTAGDVLIDLGRRTGDTVGAVAQSIPRSVR